MKRTGRVIITCRSAKPTMSAGPFPVFNGVYASVEDLEVDVLTDDGERITLGSVLRCNIRCEPGEAIAAVIEVAPEAIEVEAWAHLHDSCSCGEVHSAEGVIGRTVDQFCPQHGVIGRVKS